MPVVETMRCSNVPSNVPGSRSINDKHNFFCIILNSFSAQTDKTDDKRYDLEVKTQKTAKEIAELETRIKGIKGKFFYHTPYLAGPDLVTRPGLIRPVTQV